VALAVAKAGAVTALLATALAPASALEGRALALIAGRAVEALEVGVRAGSAEEVTTTAAELARPPADVVSDALAAAVVTTCANDALGGIATSGFASWLHPSTLTNTTHVGIETQRITHHPTTRSRERSVAWRRQQARAEQNGSKSGVGLEAGGFATAKLRNEAAAPLRDADALW
jgi:hypothetical protein